MPSPRPTKPIPSLVVNLTFTSSGCRPMRAASERADVVAVRRELRAPRRSPSRRRATVQPWSSRKVQTSLSSSMRSASFQRSSVSGKCWPMSPSPAAPSSASMIAWVSTSASEWPARPALGAISTPPSTSRRPASKRCESIADAGAASPDRLQPALAALEDRELAHADRAEQLDRPLVLVAELLGQVRVGGQRDRAARPRGTSPGTARAG